MCTHIVYSIEFSVNIVSIVTVSAFNWGTQKFYGRYRYINYASVTSDQHLMYSYKRPEQLD